MSSYLASLALRGAGVHTTRATAEPDLALGPVAGAEPGTDVEPVQVTLPAGHTLERPGTAGQGKARGPEAGGPGEPEGRAPEEISREVLSRPPVTSPVPVSARARSEGPGDASPSSGRGEGSPTGQVSPRVPTVPSPPSWPEGTGATTGVRAAPSGPAPREGDGAVAVPVPRSLPERPGETGRSGRFPAPGVDRSETVATPPPPLVLPLGHDVPEPPPLHREPRAAESARGDGEGSEGITVHIGSIEVLADPWADGLFDDVQPAQAPPQPDFGAMESGRHHLIHRWL